MVTSAASIWDNNGTPTGAIYGSVVAEAIAKMKTGISGDKTPLRPPAVLDGIEHFISNHATSGTMYLADWRTVVVGFSPSSLRFQVLREKYADQGTDRHPGRPPRRRRRHAAEVGVHHPDHLLTGR